MLEFRRQKLTICGSGALCEKRQIRKALFSSRASASSACLSPLVIDLSHCLELVKETGGAGETGESVHASYSVSKSSMLAAGVCSIAHTGHTILD